MIIQHLSEQLTKASEFASVARELAAGNDTSLSLAQSARPLVLAALWAREPRPCLYVVASEDGADRAASALSAWLGASSVCRFPERRDVPWSQREADDAVVGARCAALARLAHDEPCIVVSSARALLRCVPPRGTGYFESSSFAVGDELPFEEIRSLLVGLGYASEGELNQPGRFHVHGDSVDVFPAQQVYPVRIEFFGDEIDRARSMVASTGQTIRELEKVDIAPCREMALTPETIAYARKKLWSAAQDDSRVAADLELIEAGSNEPSLERYLPMLYPTTTSPMAHMSSNTLVVLAEPRSLFDDCVRAFEEVEAAATDARVSLEGLYVAPRELDFGKQQRLTFASIGLRGVAQAPELTVRQPAIAGADSKLIGRLRLFVREGYLTTFAVPDRNARASLELRLSDEGIPFEERLEANTQAGRLEANTQAGRSLTPGVVTFIDEPIPQGTVIPAARLASLSVADLTTRSARQHSHRRIDPTQITFPFKPGDYVVHATHGIALFVDIVRQEVGGRERDYFLLKYANEDKLFVPLEQVDRITRYVGPDGSSPRLTRLNTADWSRATNRARTSAKKLAFDLVDLYTRRSTVTGHAFGPDTPDQMLMEEDFPYELTPDQAHAITDIKADMESSRPMDRLLCGDVGFGKTEVALRAAFKCCSQGYQVMVLCPTTILAQQHFETFYTRFAPYGVQVGLLSRFITASQQRKTVSSFAEGTTDVLIGTHRLLSADINPKNLGLVVVDEEQRFGVQHKEQLKNLREQVDVLTLSATPIPRTMQMAMSGVRDMSLIMTPPAGRLPVQVEVCEFDPDKVSAAIRAELARKGQVYYVSNRVRTIDDAMEVVTQAAPEARVAVAHGQMSAHEVEDVMLAFTEGEVDVLVATTIIESGIDNAHTNTLIIEDSQRLGLAQLYQLKGRVGRGRQQAYAYFMFPGEIPLTPEATERLTAINEFQELGSGMRVAMRDLEIRGAGSLVGAEQHGNLSSVGFDLFTQMLGAAVAEARGAVPDAEPEEISINLPADFYIAEEYLPQVDKRVLVYRRLAAASELAGIDELQTSLENEHGALPLAGRNLFDRARIRVRATRLGVTSISLRSGRITFQGLQVPRDLATKLKERRAVVFPKTGKLTYPYKASDGELLPIVLGVLELIGGDDDV